MADGGAERREGLSAMYCRSLGGAEEAVAAVVNQVLTEGGLALLQKYLERKAFGYAAEAAIDAVVSNLRMCFVTHDTGEPNFEDDWALEDEPEPSNIDSWARMHLETRRPPATDGAPPGTGLSSKARTTTGRLTVSTTRNSNPRPRVTTTSTRGGKFMQVESRSAPIPDESQVDEEEEALREAKAAEEARRRDKERKAKEAEKTKEEERKSVMARHEEMRLRPHTFDQDGQVIWVDEIKAGRLPEVQEVAGFTVKKDQKARTGNLEDTLRSTLTASGKDVSKEPAQGSRSEKRRALQRSGSKAHRKAADDAWSDGFSKLQHGQPPILETMVVQSGVTLEAMGKKKAGSYGLEDRQTMTRREYNRLAERDTGATSADYRGSSAGHGAGKEPPGTAGGAREAPVVDDPAGGHDAGRGGSSATGSALGPADAVGGVAGIPGAGGGGGGEAARSLPGGAVSGLLPPLANNRGANPGRSGSGRNLGGPDAAPAQRAPPAPPASSRHMGKKFEALGYVAFQHAPREHMPRLGGRSGLGVAQPPLGATMGHGLVRHGSLKEEYFFPPQVDPHLLNVLKSQSEVSLHSGFRHGGTPKGSLCGGHPKGSLKEFSRDMLEGGNSQNGAGGHGKVKIEEMSPAYRNFRKALLPPESTGAAGPPGITSGFGGRMP